MIYPCDHLLVWPRLRFLRFRAEVAISSGSEDLAGKQSPDLNERVSAVVAPIRGPDCFYGLMRLQMPATNNGQHPCRLRTRS